MNSLVPALALISLFHIATQVSQVYTLSQIKPDTWNFLL